MLQGSLRSPLSLRLGVSETQSPFCTLLAMTSSPPAHQPEDIYLENGLLSFENPNYHLDPARFDDALNSNDPEATAALYEEICSKLDTVCNLQQQAENQRRSGSRRQYAALDLGAMGVDVTSGPALTALLALSDSDNNRARNEDSLDNMGLHKLKYTASCEDFDQDSQIDDICPERHSRDSLSEKSMDFSSPEENEMTNHFNSDNLYNIGNNKDKENDEMQDEIEESNDLPPGWEKHEDNDGPYYWHIKSGTIQREIPQKEKKQSGGLKHVSLQDTQSLVSAISFPCGVTRSNTSSALEELQDSNKKSKEERREEMALKRRSYPAQLEIESKEKAIRFAVRSLGWVQIPEDDLTPERSSRAVNRCIVDLSIGRNDLLDVVGRWGDGKDLFMDLDEGALKLIDPENLTVLNTQPIHTIRVWGVGRDNGRDFAYVARDRASRKHMCHVFRCDIPARTIANTLRDICKKIMIERSLQQNNTKSNDIGSVGSSARTGLAVRPTNLPTEQRRFHSRAGQALVTQSFPTPMEEPKKVLHAQYLGSIQVPRAAGMDILNDAILQMITTVPQEQWQHVNVAVAPSMISITLPEDEEKVIVECRVRYLSFLGIGKDVRQCAFIMHTAQDLFIAHVFNCEPSSGALCKTIEAACKLRYQKCLDAHPTTNTSKNSVESNASGSRSIGATIKTFVGSLTGRKGKSSSVES